ncbi:hypothetical protein AB6A40_009298 [Gnathostoma spinigerum]|uniref:DET1- and DDB1-associated protein 1 domain-containing protein n=1 Tax=Gnathostoma spinigerum TaxID=75299 RepID=A0ABD6ERL4_9BILA
MFAALMNDQQGSSVSSCNFVKGLPCVNKVNFSKTAGDGRQIRDTPKIVRSVVPNPDEKKITCGKKPLLLRYLQMRWSIAENVKNAKADRKRPPASSTATNNDGETALTMHQKTRRRE